MEKHTPSSDSSSKFREVLKITSQIEMCAPGMSICFSFPTIHAIFSFLSLLLRNKNTNPVVIESIYAYIYIHKLLIITTS